MVEDTVDDGRRIAELLSSELSGRSDGVLAAVRVVDPDREVEGTPEGVRAYDVQGGGSTVASVYVHETRARLTVTAGTDSARQAATETGLRTRAVATPTPQVHVFIENGAEVKRVLSVVRAVVTDATGGEASAED